MSLLDEAFESFIIMNKIRVDDGYGGSDVTWTEGQKINGAMVFNNSIEAKTAQAQGVSSVYTFTTRKNIVLDYHDVIKRESDGKIFRVTSDGDDLYTPKSAGLNMRQVSCEEWRLNDG